MRRYSCFASGAHSVRRGGPEAEPDIAVVPTHWAETADGNVLIEWLNTGTLRRPFELRGADRYTLKDEKATEGHDYSIRAASSMSRPASPDP